MAKPKAMPPLALKLLDAATAPVTGPSVDTKTMSRNQTIHIIAAPGVTFRIRIEASLDAVHWFPFGDHDTIGIRSEGQHTVQYLRAVLEEIEGGAVTVLLSWA